MNESRERIRREREREKNTYTSPRLALGPGVLQSVANELPVDLLVEALPHSSHLLETLLNRLISLEITPRPELQCESVAWRLVGLLGGDQGSGLRARTARLASALVHYSPDAREAVDNRRRQLDAAVQGLGTHETRGGLQAGIHKLEELSSVTVNQDPASSSHQRLLALSHADVERRLIDNKSLLTIVDKPALKQLPTLVASLSARVDSDKAVLACVGQIKRSDPTLDLSDTRPVAGVLMNYSRGCAALLSQMSEVLVVNTPRSPTDSASDGYHSDSDDSHQHPDRSKLVSQYAAVWSLAAEEVLPALAALDPLKPTPNLKYKIVFSVVVLSFRAAISLRDKRISEVKSLLGCESDDTPGTSGFVAAAMRLMRNTADTFPLGDAERTVINQVCSTLREYPCLESCGALHALAAVACRAAWTISLHPPLRIDTDFTPVVMNPDKHVRFSQDSRERRSDLIRSFVWPALVDGTRCVFRAVVLT
ncbi:unnamed protein product [Danaus chrysippus]|uniref:Mitochondria-eating protein n=1 Tax=Danaus chrysippus TaxID=151541 RepID=A0A8J2QTJ3_9NEOP|nr:unnamed protein product [Danaus chrysippus]